MMSEMNEQNYWQQEGQQSQYQQPQQFQQQPQYQQPQQFQQQPQYQQSQQFQQQPQYQQLQQFQQAQFQQPVRAVVYDAVPEKNHNAAVSALVLGIIGIVFCWVPFCNFVLCIIGIVCGAVSLGKKNPGTGMAVAGLILSIIGLLLAVLMTFLMILGMSEMY